MLAEVTDLPPPRDLEAPVGELVRELADHLGVRATVDLCVELLEGADRNDHPDAMPYLTGVVFDEDSPIYYPAQWKDYWVRTWGARGLLYVWDDSAAPAVVAGPRRRALAAGRDVPQGRDQARARRGRSAGGRAGRRRASCPGCGCRRCARSARSATPSTSSVVRDLLDDEEQAVRRQAARSLTQLARRLDLEPDRRPD